MAEETQEWLTASQAERASGKSRRTLTRLASQGIIARRRTEGGAWEYSSADIDRWQDAEEVEADATTMLGQAYGAINTLMGPARVFVEALQEENKRLRERCQHLETRFDEVLDKKEELMNMQHARDLETVAFTQTQDRKERVFKLIENKAFPKLLEGLGGRASAAGKLLGSLNEDQLTLLLNTDLITDEQKAWLRDVLKERGAIVETVADDKKDETNVA